MKVFLKYRKPYEREIQEHEVEILEDRGNNILVKTQEYEVEINKQKLIFKK